VIKGLLLDFYGTVVQDDDSIMEGIAAQVAAGASVPVSARDVMAAWVREYDAVAYGPRFRTLRDCATLSLATVMAEVGCDGDAAALHATQSAYWPAPPLRDGTLEFLAQVSVPICVVSDADRATLAAAIALHGLSFAAVVTSEDVGAYKPARAMFTAGLAALGLGPDEVLHVGDSLSCDVAGAHAAGIRAVWVNRLGRPAPPDAPITYEISDLRGVRLR
jgi:2-haloalkanoic acid dehalogenase type II